VFLALQGEGREWPGTFSRRVMEQFDYIFTDAMTFTTDDGRRMRLWIPEEVGEIKDHEAFMETIVDRIVKVINNEPIDIYVNATFLPDVMMPEYDKLWTPQRMQRVIDAARANGVAIEINNRYKIPSLAFVKLAKQAGIRFTCGTNNAGLDMGRDEYCIGMIQAAGLRWQDMWLPRPDGQKAVQRKSR
jgi:histidinol phosphatase-like PHP family hydrolase